MLSDNEVRARVDRLLENAIGSVGSDTRFDTTRLLDQYHGRPYGTEIPGRSQIVTREILETIEWAMPSLLRVFASGERVVMFTPEGQGDVEQAEQETDYINHCFLEDNNGWDVLNTWMRSALLERNAYVKVFWDTQRRTRVTTYEGLTEAQLAAVSEGMMSNAPTGYRFETVDILEQEVTPGLDEYGMPVELYTVKVREVMSRGFACVEYVPREEMRISKEIRDLNLDGAICVAQVRDITKSDLIELLISWGYTMDEAVAEVEALPADKNTDLASNTVQYARQNERSTQRTEYQAPDEAGKLIQLKEAYVKLDVDEDGISELRRIIYAGTDGRLLQNEEVEHQPFIALCPIPQPSAHVGLGLADVVEDIQLIKTHLMRAILDNLSLTNNPEKEVVWDNVLFPDDLETSVVGGIKRTSEQGTIREITVPFTAGSSVPIMELLDTMKEARTGISRNTMGLDADTLAKSTMGAFSMGLDQANQRLEMIARTFAETGISWLFEKMRALVVKHQDMARVVRLKDNWVEVDPRDWSERYATTAIVGLGTGRTSQTAMYLTEIANKQEQHMLRGSPMVGPENLYNTYERMIEAIGLKDVSSYFSHPETPEFQQRAQAQARQAQQNQDSQNAAAMAQINVAMQDIQQRTARDMAKIQADMAKFFEENTRKWAELEVDATMDVLGKGIEAENVRSLNVGGQNDG